MSIDLSAPKPCFAAWFAHANRCAAARFAVDASWSGVHDRERMRELDRESLRQRLHHLTDLDRRIVLERIVEHLAEEDVRRLLDGFLRFEERPNDQSPHSLLDRVRSHVAATRSGTYRGECVLRNAHGQREPRGTALWESVTAHMFDLVQERAITTWGADVATCATALADLVDEVDEGVDDLVVFEDRCSRERFATDQGNLRRLLAARAATKPAG